MSDIDSRPEHPAKAARALVAGIPLPCLGCGKPLQGRQRGACSAKCRAALSRRRREETRRERDAEIRGLLEAALRRLNETETQGTS